MFFSAALEGDDYGQGVAEEAADLGLGDEAGETVDVHEALEFGHRHIVTSLPRSWKADFPGKHREKWTSATGIYPHDFTKSL